MIGTILGLIILVVILGFVWWAGQQLLALIPLAEPFATILRILLIGLLVVIVIYVFLQLVGMAGIHVPMPVGR